MVQPKDTMKNKRLTKWWGLTVSEIRDPWNDLCILYKKIKPYFYALLNVTRVVFSVLSIIIFIFISVIALYVAFDIQSNTTNTSSPTVSTPQYQNNNLVNIPLVNIPLSDQYLFEGLLCLAGAHIAIQTLMKDKSKE